jgi:hypothetical protein
MYKTELLTELKSLDLSQEPSEDIERILREIFQGGIPLMATDYNHPKEFERAVNNTEEEPIFTTKARISFKPEKFNKTHLRASTPDNTMFYASVIPEGELSANEINYARIVGASETLDLLRNNVDGERLVTFGKWQVQGEISVITIFDPNKDYNISYINEVRDKYTSQNLSNEDVLKRDELLEFLSSEFSKKVENGENYNYMISSIFTELVVNNGADGVLYPSVQSDGCGLCLALHPGVIDRLKLIKVLQCKLIKSGRNAQLINEKFCDVNENSDTFELKKIE